MMEWQPIETAPKDGTKFLAYWHQGLPDNPGLFEPIIAECEYYFEEAEEYGLDEGDYDEDVHQWFCGPYCVCAFSDDSPTHWMPLPAPPTLKE